MVDSGLWGHESPHVDGKFFSPLLLLREIDKES